MHLKRAGYSAVSAGLKMPTRVGWSLGGIRFSVVGIVFLCELKAWPGTRLDCCVGEVMVGRKPATLAAGDELGGRIGLDLAPLQKRLKVAHLVLRETAHLIEP